MKKLLPKMLALLILMCSCNANKSFLHQRYTHFKHNKAALVKQNVSHAERGEIKPNVTATNVTATEPVAVNSAPAQTERLKYTKAVIHRAILPFVSKGVVSKGTEKTSTANLQCSNSKISVTKSDEIKPVKIDQHQKARGLLWGVIDGILAIIVLVAFVALILWIVWLYNPNN